VFPNPFLIWLNFCFFSRLSFDVFSSCCLRALSAHYRPTVGRLFTGCAALRCTCVIVSFTCIVMSESRPWPLSQKAAKQSGICSVCFATRQLHVKDGTIHQHGPRHKPCPGSNLAPIGNALIGGLGSHNQPNVQPGPACGQSNTQPGLTANGVSTSDNAPPFVSISSLASTTADTNSSTPAGQSSMCHPTYTGPIIKHIPRSARQHIAAELSSVLSHICSNPDDITNWSTLLEFGSTMCPTQSWSPPQFSLFAEQT
jgi:hypothetical protein